MKALARFGKAFGGYKMIDVPQPMCGPEDVVIEIKAAAICGADMKHYNVDSGSDEFNSIRGHEFAGCIAQVGEKVKDWKVGQRVVSDIYMTHWQSVPPFFTPIAETVAVLNELKSEGKIRAIGAANVDADHIREYLQYGELDIIQAKYSILDRAMENELLPLCRDNGIVVQVYSPLEQGLLTGTITRDYVPGGARANKVWFQRENMLKVIDMLEQWQPLCARYQCTIPTLALAWILKQSDLISILSGATAPEQVRENVAALNINLSDADATLMREMAEALER